MLIIKIGGMKMEIKLEKASIEQKSILRNLMELYNYDFTEFDYEDVNEYGLYGYKYLDHYWTEENRYPFLIKVDNKWAGFALIRNQGLNALNNDIYSVAEFFVMKKYRKMGVGKKAARTTFDTFKGEWKVGQLEKNIPAQRFWRNVISEYTNDNFEEVRESNWDGPIQKFTNI